MPQDDLNTARYIFETWNRTWKDNDLVGFLALYSDDVILESPLFPYLLGIEHGVIHGKAKLKEVIEIAALRKPRYRNFYVSNYFTDGKTILWEYPRDTPEGEQMDFIEVMEIDEGLIVRHRIYWGWKGVNTILNDTYYR
ncbi:MAG: nuclear transport factor 2 family protein [Legionellales bacterium]|nr:nuclear transport factor 2 family protein [Legionellales bacterium]